MAYIKKEQVEEVIKKLYNTPYHQHEGESYYTGLKDVAGELNTLPTVELPEVKTGTWLWYSTTMMECSNCKRHTARHKFEYCPHCGAKTGGYEDV